MVKVAICDDDVNLTTKLESIICEIARDKGIKIDVDVFFDGLPLIENIMHNNVRYDMLFLDIEMENLDGLETARKIRELDELVYLIYVTNYESYAVEAYEVHPFRFLLKPIELTVIQKYFLMIYDRISAGDMYFQYKFKKDYYKLFLKYIKETIASGILSILISMIVFFYDKFSDTIAYQYIFYIWVGCMVYMLLCTYRSVSCMMELMFKEDDEISVTQSIRPVQECTGRKAWLDENIPKVEVDESDG